MMPRANTPRSDLRGGTRNGAGRPAAELTGSTKKVSVTIDAETIDRARRIGRGNLSGGIRVAVKNYKE
jgi:hypothetical protein